jgi:ATP-dependent DNA ligase
LKHDGYRALLIKDDERISMLTRRGNDLLSFFPEIAADLKKLPDIVIDGELVMLNPEGKPDFHQLRYAMPNVLASRRAIGPLQSLLSTSCSSVARTYAPCPY